MAATGTPHPGAHYNRRISLNLLALFAGMIFALSGCAGLGGIGGGGVDFALSVSPGSQTAAAGDVSVYSVTLTKKSGLGSLVQLSASGLPSGASARFSDPTASGPGQSNLFILTAINTPPGTFSLTIKGADQTGTQSTQAMLTVTPGPPLVDILMTVTPAIQTTLGGGSVDYKVSVNADSASPVNLSVSGLPAGATATFNPPSITRSGTSTLTVTTQNPTPPGFYGLNAIGVDPTGTKTVPFSLNIPVVDFTMQQQVGPALVTAGGNILVTVTADPILGPLPPVNLSVLSGLPAGAVASFNPPNLGGAVVSSTMTITTPTSLAKGIYQIVVEGTDSTGVQTTQVPFSVTAGNPSAGFFLAAIPSQIEIQPGGHASYTIIVSNNAGPVPPLTFVVSTSLLNGSVTLTPAGNNIFTLNVSTDPLTKQTGAEFIITATGPNGVQQIDVALQIAQIP